MSWHVHTLSTDCIATRTGRYPCMRAVFLGGQTSISFTIQPYVISEYHGTFLLSKCVHYSPREAVLFSAVYITTFSALA